jgi:integrase
VGHALRDYLDWKRLAAARSHFLTLVTLINYHIIPRLASVPTEDFNGERLRHFVRDVLETPPKRGNQPAQQRRSINQMNEEELRKRKKTVNTLIGILRMALQMAWENGKLSSERAWRCMRRLPVVDRPRTLHLSRPECHTLLSECEPDLRRLVLGALYTGCRATELLRMNASHVDRDGPGVYVTPVKSYRPRFVFLPDEGLVFFRNLAYGKSGDDLLFLNHARRPWFRNYRHPFKQAVLTAGLPSGFRAAWSSQHGYR